MKKLIILSVFLLSSALSFSQPPKKMSYQAVVRNAENDLVVNASIGVQISILRLNPDTTSVYVEQHTTTTNDNGLMSIEIGTGNIISGNFEMIEWNAGPFFAKTEIDLNGSTNYTISGVSELLSVPFSFMSDYAQNAHHAANASHAIHLDGQPGSYYDKKTIIESSQCGTYGGIIFPYYTCDVLSSGNTDTKTIASVTINVPGPGKIYVSANSYIFSHNGTGTGDINVRGQLVDDNNANITDLSGYFIIVNPKSTSINNYFSINPNRVFTVTSGGNYTFYLRARLGSTTSPNVNFGTTTLTAIYTPN
jgi:hypothetical protein